MRGNSRGDSQLVRERADVRAGGGADAKSHRRSADAEDRKLVDGDALGCECGGFPFSRELVRTNALHFFRGKLRRHLLELADEFLHQRREVDVLDVHLTRLARRRAGGVIRIRGPAELDHSFVCLLHAHQIRLQPRGLADAEDKKSGRERIERPCVPHFFHVRTATKFLDDVVRSDAGNLVDEYDAIDRSLRGLHQTISCRMETSLVFASASGIGIVHPDAALCPPPPNIDATACTSTPGFARMETRVDLSSTSFKSAETSTPSIERP